MPTDLPYFRCLYCGMVYCVIRQDHISTSVRHGKKESLHCKTDAVKVSLEEATAALLAGLVDTNYYSCLTCYIDWLEAPPDMAIVE